MRMPHHPEGMPAMKQLRRAIFRSQTALVLLLSALCLLLIAWADDWKTLRSEISGVTSFKADFVQKKHLKSMDRPLTSKGTIYYQAPGSLRWEYTSPIENVTIIHEGRAARYTLSEDGVHKEEGSSLTVMQTILDKMRNWLQGEFQNSDQFSANLSPNGTIALTPRNEGMAEFISQITLRLSEKPGIIRSVTIVESPEAKTRITFSNVEVNCSIKPSVFEKVQ
ncbi:MAG: outer membrane lipoprotein carrier protein LolA [Desulfovermiculus sp.]